MYPLANSIDSCSQYHYCFIAALMSRFVFNYSGAYEVKNNNSLFGSLFKVKKNGVLLFGISFVVLEIF